MRADILDHHRAYSTYTNPGLYEARLREDVPDDVRQIGLLVRKSLIHRTTLAAGNTGTNADRRYGDVNRVSWWRQPEDDVLVTAAGMLAELYRRDARGFVLDRAPENKLVLTCRFTAILVATILKAKGIPARVRSGNSTFGGGDTSGDHWITQYWDAAQDRWISVDADASLNLAGKLDPYDLPPGGFDFPADAWPAIRAGRMDANRFTNDRPARGAIVVLWSLFYDFHCLMNDEVIYLHKPAFGADDRFARLTEAELARVDSLARLMQQPDDHFDELRAIWDTEVDFRLVEGGLL